MRSKGSVPCCCLLLRGPASVGGLSGVWGTCCGDDRRDVDRHAERHDLVDLERLAVKRKFQAARHKAGLLEFGQVHVEQGSGHADLPREPTHMDGTAGQGSKDAQTLWARHGYEQCAQPVDPDLLVRGHNPCSRLVGYLSDGSYTC